MVTGGLDSKSADNVPLADRDVEFYRRRETKLLGQLQNDIRDGKAKPIESLDEVGTMLNAMVTELLHHPLCRSLSHPPRLFAHWSGEARMGTFADVILIPLMELRDVKAGKPDAIAAMRASLAHEFGHLIARDATPEVQFLQERRDHNAEIERRADLIGAHLCGDGGAALASWAASERDKEIQMAKVFGSAWADIVKRQEDNCVTRYPELSERARYLQRWANEFADGVPLPEPMLEPLCPGKSRPAVKPAQPASSYRG